MVTVAPPVAGLCAHSIAYAEVDVTALPHNLRAVRARLAPGTGICAVVKADAYGHGLLACARALVDAGVERLGIATTDEARQLFEARLGLPILRLVPALGDELRRGIALGVEEMICSLAQARQANALAAQMDTIARVHVDIDTGMGRKGIPAEEAVDTVEQIAALPHLRLAGLMTHFPDAEAENTRCVEQARALRDIADALRARGVSAPALHMANSAAALWYPETHGDFVRVGLALYGSSPNPRRAQQPDLVFAMRVQCPIVDLRTLPAGATVGYGRTFRIMTPTRVATLAIGYADGFARAGSNRGYVLLRGTRLPVIGIVSMNLVTVDATAAPEAALGDWATVLGSDGAETISPNQLADWWETIPYEVTCRFGALLRAAM